MPRRIGLLIGCVCIAALAIPASSHETGMVVEHQAHAAHAMSPHMLMTPKRAVADGDAARARALGERLRRALQPYRDYRHALQAGYVIFLRNVPLPEYHFNNRRYAAEAARRFAAEHPTSLLYRREGAGYRLIGAMYTAPAAASLEELDRRVPTSLAAWHQHVNICMPPPDRRFAILRRDAAFGPRGSISTRQGCAAAGGRWHQRLFGWMVHVYPFADSLRGMFAPPVGQRAAIGAR